MKLYGGRLCVLAALLAGCGGAGFMQSIKAISRATSEQSSLEVSLDRLEDIEAGLDQVSVLLFKTPIGPESAWVDALNLDQPTADAYVKEIKATGCYSQPGRFVPGTKVFRLHTAKALEGAKGEKGTHQSVLAAFAELAGEPGKQVVADYEALVKIQEELAALKEKVTSLETEEDKEETTEERKTAIKAELEQLAQALDLKDKEVDAAEDKLIAAVDALGGTALDPTKLPLAKKVFGVVQHAALMEADAGLMSGIVAYQAVAATPNLHNELQTLAKRWLDETIKDATGQVVPADVKPTLSIGLSGISFGIEGMPGMDLGGVKDRLFAKIEKFYDQAVAAPGRVAGIGSKVSFQAKFLAALGTALAKMSGSTLVDTVSFVLPES